MRFMMMVKGDSKPGVLPSEEMLAAMAKYNEELMKAGVLLDLSGLRPSAEGVRIKFAGGKRTVIDGPFAESKELIAGYWIIDVKSKEEAIEWAKRVPFTGGGEFGDMAEIEIRPFFELDDFGGGPAVERHRELGEELAKRKA
jgi:hypothetical protein